LLYGLSDLFLVFVGARSNKHKIHMLASLRVAQITVFIITQVATFTSSTLWQFYVYDCVVYLRITLCGCFTFKTGW